MYRIQEPLRMDVEFAEELERVAVVTADMSHEQIDRSVREVLKLMREHLAMDVAFVSRFRDGRRFLRLIDSDDPFWQDAEGMSDPLEQSFCQRVVDGRLPELIADVRTLPNFADLPATVAPIGAHLSVPIVLPDGTVYGTMCCFSNASSEALTQRDLKRLKMAADMTARLIAKSSRRDDWDDEPSAG
jgi:GAF domain-containing protein